MDEAASAPSRGQCRPSASINGESARSHSAAVTPQATIAMASATNPSNRRRRCVRRAPLPSSQNGSAAKRSDHPVPPWGLCRVPRPRRRSADRPVMVASGSPVDQPDDGTMTSSRTGSALCRRGRSTVGIVRSAAADGPGAQPRAADRDGEPCDQDQPRASRSRLARLGDRDGCGWGRRQRSPWLRVRWPAACRPAPGRRWRDRTRRGRRRCRGRRGEGTRRQLADDGARLDAAVLVLVARSVELERAHVPRGTGDLTGAVTRCPRPRGSSSGIARGGRPMRGGRPSPSR